MADQQDDLAGGSEPSSGVSQDINEILEETRSRRTHRRIAGGLLVGVVVVLLAIVANLVNLMRSHQEMLRVELVAMYVSTIVAVTVLSIALAKFAYGLSNGSSTSKTEDAPTAPSVEAVSLVGELLAKFGELLKASKP